MADINAVAAYLDEVRDLITPKPAKKTDAEWWVGNKRLYHADVPHLLAALDRVLAIAAGWETMGTRAAIGYVASKCGQQIREAIAAELLGEGSGDG